MVDGVVSEEKIAELLALGTEYPELDYKSDIDLTTSPGAIELAKDIGAMRVRGGYILGGVDDQGRFTGSLDAADHRPFDEANLVPKMLRYLSRPLEIRSNVVEREGHAIAAICVLPSARGCTFFTADGRYMKGDTERFVFRKGDVFWRDGTRSVRMGQEGLEEVIERRISREKDEWVREQQEIRRRERTELEEAYSTRRLGEGPLGSVSLDLDTRELSFAVLELVRRNDTIALRHLLADAAARARRLIETDDIEDGLGHLVDQLSCLASTFVLYDQRRWFEEIVDLLVRIYAMPLGEGDVRRFGYSSRIDEREVAPRVWLVVIERVYALGALAVRRMDWRSVRTLTLQLPPPLAEEGYDTNWLRHALTMASRAQQFEARGGEQHQVSLLTLARAVATRVDCMRPDGLASDDDELLSSLAQFDVLSNVVAIGAAKDVSGRVFYTNFARFRQSRVQRVVERLLSDSAMREELFPLADDDLAIALNEIGQRAQQEGWRYDGFDGWGHTPVGGFIATHLPEDEPPQP